ncbi:MAG: ferredoxin family protein [Chloroflexi bacterium]|nr:ferredoxin family protein [Chloroflexota bacterium]
MTVNHIDLGACLRCGICSAVCPNDVLREAQDHTPYIAYPEDCTACRLCEERCTFDAIAVKPGAVKKSSEIFAFRQYLIGLGLAEDGRGDA